VHSCKTLGVRCFCFTESTVTLRGSDAKTVQHDPPFFCAYDKPSLFFGLQKTCWQIVRLLRKPCGRRSSSAPDLFEPCTESRVVFRVSG